MNSRRMLGAVALSVVCLSRANNSFAAVVLPIEAAKSESGLHFAENGSKDRISGERSAVYAGESKRRSALQKTSSLFSNRDDVYIPVTRSESGSEPGYFARVNDRTSDFLRGLEGRALITAGASMGALVGGVAGFAIGGTVGNVPGAIVGTPSGVAGGAVVGAALAATGSYAVIAMDEVRASIFGNSRYY